MKSNMFALYLLIECIFVSIVNVADASNDRSAVRYTPITHGTMRRLLQTDTPDVTDGIDDTPDGTDDVEDPEDTPDGTDGGDDTPDGTDDVEDPEDTPDGTDDGDDTPDGTDDGDDTPDGTDDGEDDPSGTDDGDDTPDGTDDGEDDPSGTDDGDDTPDGTDDGDDSPDGTDDEDGDTPASTDTDDEDDQGEDIDGTLAPLPFDDCTALIAALAEMQDSGEIDLSDERETELFETCTNLDCEIDYVGPTDEAISGIEDGTITDCTSCTLLECKNEEYVFQSNGSRLGVFMAFSVMVLVMSWI